jgi:uncharacterized protein YdeI (YjbR/CyaY-like superfamily)
MNLEQKPTFFRSPAELQQWFATFAATASELWVGFYKQGTGEPSITWPQSVAEALCCGWIDGVRKGIDAASYMIRFSPRRPSSVWSSVNIQRAEALIAAGRMTPAGLAAFAARKENKSGIYSYEQRRAELEEPYSSMLAAQPAAWDSFHAQSPAYRKAVNWWIVSAKREATRLRRLEKLVDYSARGELIPEMRRQKPTL